MDRPGITIEYDISDTIECNYVGECSWPIVGIPQIGNKAGRVAPKRLIARVEPNTDDFGSGCAQHTTQCIEEWTMGTLQEQEHTPVRAGG